ncbi:MAG: class I tRNA ligase family protein, partial [Luteibaculum sp.]
GRSSVVYRDKEAKYKNNFVPKKYWSEYCEKYPSTLKEYERFQKLHVDINLLDGDEISLEKFRKMAPDYAAAEFYPEGAKNFPCDAEVEKMSKSKLNVQNPDDLVQQYGADTLRCYEMFLGPLEQHKPWDTQGITGVYNFLRKLWRLYHPEAGNLQDTTPDKKELKVLHTAIKGIQEDIERLSFNTVVSKLMICVNELQQLNCSNKQILEPLAVLVSPYAPHMAEELWQGLGNAGSISFAPFPQHKEEYLVEDSFEYPVSFNGKMRFKMELPRNLSKEKIEEEVLSNPQTAKYLSDKKPKKVIVVPNKIVNVVA